MFEKIRKMKNQKGFTLVELIVVLVILAILAAMLVPALTGYIDKANNQKIKAATRQVVMAAQTEISEAYSKGGLTAGKIVIEEDKDVPSGEVADIGKKIVVLAEVGSYNSLKYTLTNNIKKITINYNDKGHVTSLILTQGELHCKYDETKADYEMVESNP